MIKGQNIDLRLIKESDIDPLYNLHSDIANRGDFYQLNVKSETIFKQQFQENGFWGDDYGRLLIVNKTNEILGSILYFKSVFYFDALEIGYIIFDLEKRGKGVMTEALKLFVEYLFNIKNINRLEVRILPENKASEKVALKCGFIFEGAARQAIFHQGTHFDLNQYSLLRSELEKSV